MVVSAKQENAGTFEIERDVEVVRDLIQKMRSIRVPVISTDDAWILGIYACSGLLT